MVSIHNPNGLTKTQSDMSTAQSEQAQLDTYMQQNGLSLASGASIDAKLTQQGVVETVEVETSAGQLEWLFTGPTSANAGGGVAVIPNSTVELCENLELGKRLTKRGVTPSSTTTMSVSNNVATIRVGNTTAYVSAAAAIFSGSAREMAVYNKSLSIPTGSTWQATSIGASNLFPANGASLTNLHQGSDMEDCAIVSGLESYFEQDPTAFKNGIVQVGPDQYQVTLYNTEGQPTSVVVDSKFPVDASGNPIGINFAQYPAFALYEKAILVQFGKADKQMSSDPILPSPGGYTSLYGENGLSPDTVLWTLTGKNPTNISINSQSTLSTDDSTWNSLLTAYNSKDISIVYFEDSSTRTSNPDTYYNQSLNIINDHGYSIANMTATSITLLNPWGSNGDGIPAEVTLTKQQFINLMQQSNDTNSGAAIEPA